LHRHDDARGRKYAGGRSLITNRNDGERFGELRSDAWFI
jgi:hypothetical protein